MKKLFTILILLVAINANSQWVQVFNISTYGGVNSFISHGSNIFCATDSNLYLSTNNGSNWSPINYFAGNMIYTLALSGNNIYASAYTDSFGIFISTNDGTTWARIGTFTKIITSIALLGNNIFAGSYGNGIYRTSNNGNSWEQVGLNNLNILALTTKDNNIFAGVYNYPAGSGGVYISTNNGTNWIQKGLNNEYVRSLTVSGYYIFAGVSENGVYFSTNIGNNWVQTSLNNKSVYSFAVDGNNIFAGAGSGGVFLSTNFGSNWINKNQGFTQNLSISSLQIFNTYIFAGAFSNLNIWRRSLSDIIRIKNISSEIPSTYTLNQNYPNPFNPTTNIRYQILKNNFVVLEIFDVLGHKVETLVNEKQQAGTYEVVFNGNNFSSGVYFYKLTAGDFIATKKMMLIK